MEEIVKQLEKIVEKYKKNKKINKNDQDNARKGLETLLQSTDYVKVAFGLIPNLPPGVSIQAFISTWKGASVDQRKELINKLTGSDEMKSNAGYFRIIGIIKELIPEYTEEATELLLYISLMNTKSGKEVPGKVLTERFRKELLENRYLLKFPVEKRQLDEVEISAISAMVLCSIVEKGEFNEEYEELLSDILDWLLAAQKRVFIGKKVIDYIEKVSKDWPEYLQRKCLDLGVIKTLRLKGSEKKVPESSEIIEKGKENEKVLVKKEDVTGWLEKITKYIEGIEKENDYLKKAIKDLRCQLEQERQIIHEKEKEIEKMQAVLRETNEKLVNIEKQKAELQEILNAEKRHHEEEVMRLKDRIESECNYVLEEFKGKLYDKLFRYYKDFNTAKNRPGDAQIADYLKSLTEKIFKVLIGAGINLEKTDW
ncbi:hypothetical protein SAMN02745221_01879 [Thermosyntropha lipolytica DSM 11003]|uniref:Uncharacterized protein n=1 Tax=Thermosyntropha lipolytica DSM 11003 TaxID=1123382 RepID=A0A1M5QX80_9FIRM|nr:hypothetical protein [Thermosyntropha lipolytica]SHH18735.1 hypothetical protein SAMN02745221_01879 [Thermosyntropha lipolytica DSM 11003]